jgi:chromate transport protein ChrA
MTKGHGRTKRPKKTPEQVRRRKLLGFSCLTLASVLMTLPSVLRMARGDFNVVRNFEGDLVTPIFQAVVSAILAVIFGIMTWQIFSRRGPASKEKSAKLP